MGTPKRGFWARLRRFWQSLTGSGVVTYDDERFPGAHDESSLGTQGQHDIRNRNGFQFGTKT